jgi:hypothetical protein
MIMAKSKKRSFRSVVKRNYMVYSDKSLKSIMHVFNEEIEGLRGRMVPVTYTLEKTGRTSLFSLSIGYTHIDLEQDQDPANDNQFSTRDGKKYTCFMEDDGLRITLRAEGKVGDSWTLNVMLGQSPLNDNPVEEYRPDENGRLDHDEKHN